MAQFKINQQRIAVDQIRELKPQYDPAKLSASVENNALDEVIFESEGKTYLAVGESLQLSGLKGQASAQLELNGVSKEVKILALQDDIGSFAEGWSKGRSWTDSLAKAFQGMGATPDWQAIHTQTTAIGKWPQAVSPVESLPTTTAIVTAPPKLDPKPAVESKPKVEVMFTRPGAGEVPLDQKVAAFIKSADKTVDIAAFELESPVIRDAILAAHKAGKQVRVVTDSNYKDEHDIHALQSAGIEVIDDNRSGLMHNKFVVIDQGSVDAAVLTGSMNFTDNGVYRNDNNLLILRSPELAENYGIEFKEMFEDRQFGVSSPHFVAHPSVTVGSSTIATHFAAEGAVIGKVAEALNKAEHSIQFLTFSYTHDDVNQVVMQKMADGVKVRGVFDNTQAGSRYSKYHDLKAAGADVRRDGNSRVMHHKVFVIDEKTVITGSFNFSKSADKSNDENLLIIEDPTVARAYLQEFERVYNQAKPE